MSNTAATVLSQRALEAMIIEATMIAKRQISEQNAVSNDEKQRRIAARSHLLNFTTYTKPDYEVNWHHEAICNVLTEVINGLLPVDHPKYNSNAPKRVILCAPPRNGKSELVSRRLPAYAFGKLPDLQVIGSAYGADLASLMNRDIQRIMIDEKYITLFPKTRLNETNVRSTSQGSYLRNSDIFEIVGYRGRYRSAGVGGGITGMGANLAIIDDPFKDQMEAQSETIRNSVWEWYTTTFYTRLEKNAAIVIMHTRWHEDDLVGRLLDLAKRDPKADQWLILNFPAILDDENERSPFDNRSIGEPLWPNKYSLEALATIRANDPNGFEALQQQRPVKPGGSLFPRTPFKLIDDFHVHDECVLVRYWDKAGTEGSGAYTAGSLLCYDPQRTQGVSFVVLDIERFQYEAHERETRIRNTAQLDAKKYGRNRVTYWLEQEPGSGGKESNQNTIQNTLRGYIVKSETVSSKGDKELRATPYSIQVKAGNVGILNREWTNDYLNEAEKFPRGKFKDQIDASSGAFNKLAIEEETTQNKFVMLDNEPDFGYVISPF